MNDLTQLLEEGPPSARSGLIGVVPLGNGLTEDFCQIVSMSIDLLEFLLELFLARGERISLI